MALASLHVAIGGAARDMTTTRAVRKKTKAMTDQFK